MSAFLRRAIEGAFLRLAGIVPARLAAHLMFLLRNRPDITDRWGYHIRAIHYYEPLPDFRLITAEQLQRPRVSPAIDFRLEQQQALMCRLSERFGDEIKALAGLAPPRGFDFRNPYFSGLDAAVYYALIRDLSPKLVIEIGSGYSTQIASKAIERNAADGKPGRLVCVEPFPEPRLTQSGAQFELEQKRVQHLPLTYFDQLEANDILLIDSSHVATVGSDVCFEILEILPRLKPGVWVHVHDIFFPEDYPAGLVVDRRVAWNEQYVLEAFLAFNQNFQPEIANSWLWHQHFEATRTLFDSADKNAPPASFWMRRIA